MIGIPIGTIAITVTIAVTIAVTIMVMGFMLIKVQQKADVLKFPYTVLGID
jgi:hypothetical protein